MKSSRLAATPLFWFLIFDIYIYNGINCKDLPLIKRKGKKEGSRYNKMNELMKKMNRKITSITNREPTIDIELKNPIINIIFNKFFNYGFEKILNSFEQRARETIKY